MRPDALEYFIDVYNREVAGATARHAVERQALEAEMGRVDREIANLVTAIAGGLNNPSVKARLDALERSEEHTSELQSLMRISYAVFCLKKKKAKQIEQTP